MSRLSRLIPAASLLAAALALPAPQVVQAYHTPHELPLGYDVQPIDDPTPGVPTYGHFGDGVVNAGDVNGDGKADLLVGGDEHGGFSSGEAHLFSGATGSLIRTIPAPDPDAGGSGDNGDGFGTYVGKLNDIGSCPGFSGSPGADCTAGAIGAADGVPEQLVSSIGIDIDADGDDMGTGYVIDGATGAVLKRIVMPPADRAEQAGNLPTASQGPGFGRTIINPAGQAPCAGNLLGAGPCPADAQAVAAVAEGDLDGLGEPDIVIGASDFTEDTLSNPACNDGMGSGVCFQAGRFYVYAGEAIAGSDPSVVLATPLYTLKNPFAQHDASTTNSRFFREAMGYSVAPVGDLGKCNTGTISPGTFCLNTANTTAPDGKPEFIASTHRYDDFGGMGDVGAAFVIDGPTGRILDVHRHPEPQPTSIFAFSNYNQPAIGDAGSNTAPDVYQGAMIQTVGFKAQGRGYVLSGDFRSGGANHYSISVLDDGTPNKIGNFGTSSAGIGDVAGDSRNEIMIGAYGPHAPEVYTEVVNDVHIFDPVSDKLLQTIADPDQQQNSGFGRALAPLGDVNGDGFLDFAVGAGKFDVGTSADQGRVYLFRSDNTPDVAERTVTLKLRKHLRAKGQVDAAAGPEACEDGVPVEILRGKKVIKTVSTNAIGRFKTKIPDRPGRYRARATEVVAGEITCLEEESPKRRHKH